MHEIKSQLSDHIGLRIAHINVCSLYPKIDEIRLIIFTLNLDALCISETWLNDQIGNHEISIEGYDLFRKDRINKRGGGVCIFVKSSLTVKNREDLISEFDIEAVIIELKCKTTNLLISCIYRPPNSDQGFFEICTDMLEKIIMDDKELVVLGDLNIDYDPDSDTPIHALECLFSLHQLVNKPTRVTTSSSTCIDLILSTMPESHSISDVGYVSLSDHYMIFTCVDCNVERSGHKTARFRDFSRFNHEDFINDLCNCDVISKPSTILDSVSIEDTWRKWITEFIKICNKHAPIKSVRVKNRLNPWISNAITDAMHKRDYLKRKAKNDETLFQMYRTQRNMVTKEIRKAKTEYLSSVSDKYRNNPKKLWSELNKATGNLKYLNNAQNDLSPDEFNDFFVQVGQKISDSFNQESLNWKNPDCLYKFKFLEILKDDVLKLLKCLPCSNNLDILDVDCKLLNIAAPYVSETLTAIFNLSLKTGIVLDDWKYARVTPIYKGKGDKEVLSNYRPISVVSHIAKIVEKLVQNQFISYLLSHNFITVEQSAFLRNHSTVTCLHRVIDDWHEALNEREVVAVCFFDISKCFDAISHELLLLKLQYHGVNENELNWFKSYLTGRKQKVSINGNLSKPNNVMIGIPQGGVLGPVLFLLFINDIIQSVNTGTCNIFADDVAIYCNGSDTNEVESKLQSCINEIDEWYTNNRLKINADKTNVILVSSRAKQVRKELNVNLKGTKLKQVDSVRYLGLTIDSKLTWDNHVKHLCKNLSYKVASLRRLSNTLNTTLLNTLYKSTIQPCIDYACSVWGNCSLKNRNLIRRIQKRAARIVSKQYGSRDVSVSALFKDLKWQSFETRRDYFLNMLMYKCIHGTAPLRLCNEIEMYFDRHGLNTRNASSLNVVLPKPNTEMFKQSFRYSGANIWNSLHNALQNATTLPSFKRIYKQTFF